MSWLLLALAVQAGPDVKLAEIEVARGEKPKVNTRLGKDEDDGNFVARLSWRGGNDPGVPRPATSFGAMTLKQARDWAVEIVRASLEGDWDDLSHPTTDPDCVTTGAGQVIPMGWTLRLLQLHKGLAFEDEAGVYARLSDDPSRQEQGATTARLTVRRWTVVKEHGPAKPPFPREKVVAALKADFAKIRPDAKDVDVEISLVWAAKPGAENRRVPVWEATLEAPSRGIPKPTERRYRADGWTGAILLAEDVARPGR
jgi:hypothetical protein